MMPVTEVNAAEVMVMATEEVKAMELAEAQEKLTVTEEVDKMESRARGLTEEDP